MSTTRTVAVVTGTRAEFGLLRPVMHAIAGHPHLRLRVIATGAHLLPPDLTVREIEREFDVSTRVEMQRPGETGRLADAEALGRGVAGLARCYRTMSPDIALVLGDRIEAFAAAGAAAVGGVLLAHLHGGDRASGVADEGMRHAITKLAHLHLAASEESAQRIVAMGEPPDRVHVVGSPALDGLDAIPPIDEETYVQLGAPQVLMLLHPIGRDDASEAAATRSVLAACRRRGPTLALHPNHDPGRGGVVTAIEAAGIPSRSHLPRPTFVGLLRRVEVLVGNSSAGLIEAAALGLPSVNIGPRQSGRQRPASVVDAAHESEAAITAAIDRARTITVDPASHPFGDGRAGERVSELLATVATGAETLRKRSTY